MSALDFDRLCATLPRLTPTQLKQVRLRLGALGADEAPAKDKDDRDWLLAGLEAELRRRGVLGKGKLLADRIVPGWKETSALVREDLVEALGGSPDPRRLGAYGALVARTLADYLSGGGVPISPKTLLTNVSKALAAVDAQFPGYAEAGLLGCCLAPDTVGRTTR